MAGENAASPGSGAQAAEETVAVAQHAAEGNIALQRLRLAFPTVPFHPGTDHGFDWAVVPGEAIVEVCRFLRDDPQTRFNQLSSVTVVDLLPHHPRWEVVYHLLSLPRNARFRLKVELADSADPETPSVCGVWSGANFYEREMFDLMGIRFAGHPDLRRILLPDDWQGHPLRYDHPLGGEEVGFTS